MRFFNTNFNETRLGSMISSYLFVLPSDSCVCSGLKVQFPKEDCKYTLSVFGRGYLELRCFLKTVCFNSAYLRHAVCLVYFWLPIVCAQGHNRIAESSEFNVQRARENCKLYMEDFKSSSSAFGMGSSKFKEKSLK